MIDVALSISETPIRLTKERWFHIVEHHDDLAGRSDEVLQSIDQPDFVARGQGGELLAVKAFKARWMVVVYRESKRDGFIITAFQTSRITSIKKRGIVWPKPSKKH